MRDLVFERWARRELAKIGHGSFNMQRLAAKAQADEDLRLQALLLLYAEGTGRVDRLLEYVWNVNLADEYRAAAAAIGGRDIGKLAHRGTPLRALPPHYTAVLADFVDACDATQAKASAKRDLWQATRQTQLKKGIPNSDIYRALGLNPGNANAYLKHGATEKVSLANAQRMKDYVDNASPQY